MPVWKDCHQGLPKVLLKWWLSLKIVINTAEVVYIFKTVINTAEVVYVFVCVCVLVCVCLSSKECDQFIFGTVVDVIVFSPKVLLKWWLSWRLSYMSISCTLFVAKCVCFMFFRLWGSRMIVSGLEASLVLWFGSWQNGGVDYWSAKLSLDSMLLIWGLAGFNQFFQIVGFWPLPGQNVFFLASSGTECLPGVHSDVRA